jgi:hypothetical protein
MKPSEFLKKYIESHGIYEHEKYAIRFRTQVGDEPCWPTSTVAQVERDISRDPHGGEVHGKPNTLTCSGYQMASAMAVKYAKFHSTKIGRGFLFRDCIDHLEKAGF